MILYGASGHAKVVKDIVIANGDMVSKFIDDNPLLDSLHGIRVEHSYGETSERLIIAIGDNATRKKIVEHLSANYGTVIHPTAIVSGSVLIREGTVVMQAAVIQADARIGRHCIINTASIDHECRIEDYVHVSPHATLCGNVSVGEGSWIGAGATLLQGIRVGRWCVVGAGSVVTRDVPDYTRVVGNRVWDVKEQIYKPNKTVNMLKKLKGGGRNSQVRHSAFIGFSSCLSQGFWS